jgi:hypothetical protein
MWPVNEPLITAVAICQKWLNTPALAYIFAFFLLHVPVHFPAQSCTRKSIIIHSLLSTIVSKKRRIGEDTIKEVLAADSESDNYIEDSDKENEILQTQLLQMQQIYDDAEEQE